MTRLRSLPKLLVAVAFLGLVSTLVVGAVPAARDAKAPRIVAAAMQDVDGDARADRVRLTYSEPVRHVADRDGTFPFTVAGYRFRAVGRASGKAIVVLLVERSTVDGALQPVVRYRRTSFQPVLDRGGNQAVGQVFHGTHSHGNAPTPTPQPQPTPQAPAVTDRDGDGVDDGQDCAPGNAAISPRAVDLPDLAFVDSNCDGIDGTEKNAIFVASTGKDGNPGTRLAPKAEIRAGVVAAALAGKDVYVGGGDYARVETASGVDVYGGYLSTTWQRRVDVRTRIVGTPEAVLVSGDTVVLQLLDVLGRAGVASGSTAYGIRAVGGSKLTLQRVNVVTTAGTDGTKGVDGSPGQRGGDGSRGEAGSCDGEVGGFPGPGGGSPAGSPGGYGGRGGLERLNRDGLAGLPGKPDTPGGVGGANGNPGKPGSRGTDGLQGTSGRHGDGGSLPLAAAQRTWAGNDGTAGTSGTPGKGGGGGGGGGGQKGRFVIDGKGNAGGAGGGGGGGGAGGKGGTAGGGSFGVYLHDSTATLTAKSSIQAGNGGTGGAGGRGGLPGIGGAGGLGGTYCTGEVGAGGDGGRGGSGGIGGGGGGGAGGPSVGLLKAGSSTATIADTRIEVGIPGPAGVPGPGGGGGGPSYPGVARAVFP